MLATISSGWANAFIAFAGLAFTLLSALIIGVWRIGSKVGGMTSTLTDHEVRMDRIQVDQRAHDQWHMERRIV